MSDPHADKRYPVRALGMTPEQAAAFGEWLNEWAGIYRDDNSHQERYRSDQVFREGWNAAVSRIFERFVTKTHWHVASPRQQKAAPQEQQP